MSLLGTRHANPETAALSIATNRASKIDKLRTEADTLIVDGGTYEQSARLLRMADHNANSLRRDIADWLGNTAAGKRANAHTVAQLFMIGDL